MTRRERSVVPSTGPLPPSSVAAIILCGGESRRFGRDKALATYRGQRLLDRVVECAGARADQVILACGKTPRYAETGLALALDPPGTDGPLAGIVAGLALADRDIALLLAIDLAAITPAGLDRLFAQANNRPASTTERALRPGVAGALGYFFFAVFDLEPPFGRSSGTRSMFDQ